MELSVRKIAGYCLLLHNSQNHEYALLRSIIQNGGPVLQGFQRWSNIGGDLEIIKLKFSENRLNVYLITCFLSFKCLPDVLLAIFIG